jgi:hypothetical protein
LVVSRIHRLRNLLTVILGGIQTNNMEVAMRAVRSMQRELDGCRPCPLVFDQPAEIRDAELGAEHDQQSATQDAAEFQ